MEFQAENLWKADRLFILLPMVIIHNDEEETGIALGWLIWGCEITFNQKKKQYVTCKVPIPKVLSKGEDYLVIKTLNNAYVVKRDDGSIDKISKERFSDPFWK